MPKASAAQQETRIGRVARYALSGAFVITWLIHLLAAVALIDPGESTSARHLVFSLINALFSVLFFRRVRWTILPFAALALQQAQSHGTDLANAAKRGNFDMQSALVLLFFPIALAYAWRLWSPAVRGTES
jgi:hypothetical protein